MLKISWSSTRQSGLQCFKQITHSEEYRYLGKIDVILSNIITRLWEIFNIAVVVQFVNIWAFKPHVINGCKNLDDSTTHLIVDGLPSDISNTISSCLYLKPSIIGHTKRKLNTKPIQRASKVHNVHRLVLNLCTVFLGLWQIFLILKICNDILTRLPYFVWLFSI